MKRPRSIKRRKQIRRRPPQAVMVVGASGTGAAGLIAGTPPIGVRAKGTVAGDEPPSPPRPQPRPEALAWQGSDQTGEQIRDMYEGRRRRNVAATGSGPAVEPPPFMAGADRSSTPLPLRMAPLESTPASESVQVPSEPSASTVFSEAASITGGVGTAAVQAAAMMGGEGTMPVEAGIIPGPMALYQEILRRLVSVEEAVDALSRVRAGIGHNKPPERIDSIAFDNDDWQAIKIAISTVRALPAAPETPPDEAREAVDQIARIGEKTKAYAAKQGDNFISEIVKESAKGALIIATGGIGIAYLLYLLAERLMDAANAIQAWLDLLGSLH
jgi:hypothetical protein